MNPDRIPLVRQIDDLLDAHCNGCKVRTEFNRTYGGNTSFVTHHCSKVCPIGVQLGELGAELHSKIRPRKKPLAEPGDDKSPVDKPKFTMSQAEYNSAVAEGKTKDEIAQEQGVTLQAIYYHLKRWARENKLEASGS